MDTLQDLRYKLQKRYSRLQSADGQSFAMELIRFWGYFDSIPEFVAIAAELNSQHPNIGAEIDSLQRGSLLHGGSESESAAIGYDIGRRAATVEQQGLRFHDYSHGGLAESLDAFRSTYIEPFYEYVDEHLQDSNLVLAYLVRFKHLAEWFRREQLWGEYSSASRSGERTLAFRLYEYLYEQGIDFSIEPTSASGEVDMIASQGGKDRLLADVKVFNPADGRGVSYIEKGFHQVYRYLQDFNRAVGYLIVFKTADRNLHLDGAEGDVPRKTVCNKTIFFIEIDIYPHPTSASKRGLTESEVITFDESTTAALRS